MVRSARLLGVLVLAACLRRGDTPAALSPADRGTIDSLMQAYVAAWLRDDTLGVLGTFASDAMLLPPGQLPVQGSAAMRAWWWPADGSRTTVTAFTLTSDELEGGGDWAFARGMSTLAWTYFKDGKTTTQVGRNISMTIYHRQPDGGWRIARQMWGPSLPATSP